MPTIITHAVVPLALGLGLGAGVVSRRLLLAGIVASVMPDVDVVAFKLGIAYGDAVGHRGASHSIAFALLLGVIALLCARRLQATRAAAFAFVGLAALSHPLLDMFTDGGLGVALWWPFSLERVFAPWQVIAVSPIGINRFLSARGLAVLQSELMWVWVPMLALFSGLYLMRRARPA
jgi:inner membrane protein